MKYALFQTYTGMLFQWLNEYKKCIIKRISTSMHVQSRLQHTQHRSGSRIDREIGGKSERDEYSNIFEYLNISLQICDIRIRIPNFMATNMFVYSDFCWRIFKYWNLWIWSNILLNFMVTNIFVYSEFWWQIFEYQTSQIWSNNLLNFVNKFQET